MIISEIEFDNLDKALNLFIRVFRPYVVSILIKRFGDDWTDDFARTLSAKQWDNWQTDLRKGKKPESLIDFQYFKTFALNKETQKLLWEDFEYQTYSLPTWFAEIYDVRNSLKHTDDSIEKNKATKVWIHLCEIAKLIGNDELEQEILDLQEASIPQTIIHQPVTPQITKTPTVKKFERTKPNFIQHSIDTLDIVNCSGLWQEVFADEVYLCPAQGGAYSHRQCKYFGAYFDKRIGAIGEIEAVMDVNSEDDAEIYWTNYEQNTDNYLERAKEKANELRPDEFPIRVFLLKDLYSTNFVKDSKGGMQSSKMYKSLEDFDGVEFSNAKELAEFLDGKQWSDFGL